MPSVSGCADAYVPGPAYCTCGLRLLASCVPYVPGAQGSLPPGRHAPCMSTLASLERAVRSAYRGTPGERQAAASAELQRMNAFFTDVDQGSLEVETVAAPL